jgi:hypothetical protein
MPRSDQRVTAKIDKQMMRFTTAALQLAATVPLALKPPSVTCESTGRQRGSIAISEIACAPGPLRAQSLPRTWIFRCGTPPTIFWLRRMRRRRVAHRIEEVLLAYFVDLLALGAQRGPGLGRFRVPAAADQLSTSPWTPRLPPPHSISAQRQ